MFSSLRTFCIDHYYNFISHVRRPRHIHLRASADGHVGVVTQIYFGGDPYLGDKDTACGFCKSDDAMLVVPLGLLVQDEGGEGGETTSFSLADLKTEASAAVAVLSPSSASSSSSSPSPSSSVVIVSTGLAAATLLSPSPSSSSSSSLSSSLLPSSSPPVEKENTIQMSEDTSGGAGLRCTTTCQLGLYVLTVVVAFL